MSNFWKRKYKQAEPIPAKYLHADGTIDENSGIAIDAYTKEETNELIENIPGKKFTYIVNSDDSLKYWLTNKASGTSSGGDDFTSVLIKKGTYSVNYATANLSDIGTEYVEGETGNTIKNYHILFKNTSHYSGTYSPYRFNNLHIINYASAGTSVRAFDYCNGIFNCQIEFDATDASEASAFGCYVINNCYELDNVHIQFINGTTFDAWKNGSIVGFNNCTDLRNCKFYNSWNTSGGTSSAYVYAFSGCSGVTNCGVNAYALGHAIYNCKRVLHCNVSGYQVSDKYGSSYASSSATSTYACADTANGGFNV